MSLRELIGSRYISEEKKFNKAGEWKITSYTVTCPIDGCQNTCKVEKSKHLNNKCRQHSFVNNSDRSKWAKPTKIKKYICSNCNIKPVANIGVLCSKCRGSLIKKRPYERTFNQANKKSERSRIDGTSVKWKLTYEQFASLCELPECHYCKKFLNRAKFKSDIGSTAILIDRKDSELHYTLDNCVPCCPKCNDTKGRYISYQEMIVLMDFRKSFQTMS